MELTESLKDLSIDNIIKSNSGKAPFYKKGLTAMSAGAQALLQAVHS